MGLFNKKPDPEELEAMEANKGILEKFNATAAWGVKSTRIAEQFVYDEDMKAFCIVQGPVEDDGAWKEKNPWVIRFNEVEDVCLFVDEWWSENNNKYDKTHSHHILTLDKFDEVYWKYDLYMRFKTTHPYAKDFEYRMNFSTNILMIPGAHIFARRGLELNGEYRGKEIREKRIELEAYAESLKKNLKQEMIYETIAKKRPDSILGRLKKDLTNDWYVSKVENVAKHVKRGGRIWKLINNNK